MTEKNKKPPHHHGNLQAALIQAGMELLAEGGNDALTLRRCAARAGVSHAAPAHHFDGLLGLKAAIATEGFRTFRTYMLDAARSGAQSPRGRLKSICRGYLQFAMDNPALFDLIFGFKAEVMTQCGMDRDNAIAYDVLRQTCAPFVPDGQNPAIVETQVWSLIHGYTTLFMSGRLWPEGGGEAGQGPFDQVMALLDRIGTDPAD
ncbi:TetR/AcrR family transcriptional regulator [Actibacterium sp. D379-3]